MDRCDDFPYQLCYADQTKPAPDFQRVSVSGHEDETSVDPHELQELGLLIKAMKLRQKYMRISLQSFPPLIARFLERTGEIQTDRNRKAKDQPETSKDDTLPATKNFQFEIRDGVYHVYKSKKSLSADESIPYEYPDMSTFVDDYSVITGLMANGPMRTFSKRHLHFLSSKFKLHKLLNAVRENKVEKGNDEHDFRSVVKVDTHIHASACMTGASLLSYIQRTAEKYGNDVVIDNGGEKITLNDIFKKLNTTPSKVNLTSLGVHADIDTFERFDTFNDLYNPLGTNLLKTVFLKTHNDCNGKFFAEIVKESNKALNSKTDKRELRVSVHGTSPSEWDDLARWAVTNNLLSDDIRWVIQVPRVFDVFVKFKQIKNFQEHLINMFLPLFEVSADPKSHPELAVFLRDVIGFDSVDDESKPENALLTDDDDVPLPKDWCDDQNPPYAYYLYYTFANMCVLNQFRRHRGLNTFVLRPHSGESGEEEHLACSFLLAKNISHGIRLKSVPVLQYLYYLCQIGIAMSPLSNNYLFLRYHDNPFPEFFAQGLHVSLSTDDPMQFHYTQDPMSEEYSIASEVWKLSTTDVCEVARNSCLMSGFPHKMKQAWIGTAYQKEGIAGNDVTKTNVPDIRVAYRHETLIGELCEIMKAMKKN